MEKLIQLVITLSWLLITSSSFAKQECPKIAPAPLGSIDSALQIYDHYVAPVLAVRKVISASNPIDIKSKLNLLNEYKKATNELVNNATFNPFMVTNFVININGAYGSQSSFRGLTTDAALILSDSENEIRKITGNALICISSEGVNEFEWSFNIYHLTEKACEKLKARFWSANFLGRRYINGNQSSQCEPDHLGVTGGQKGKFREFLGFPARQGRNQLTFIFNK